MNSRKSQTKARRRKEISELFAEIRQANKDPAYRKALREFIDFHTGKLSPSSKAYKEYERALSKA